MNHRSVLLAASVGALVACADGPTTTSQSTSQATAVASPHASLVPLDQFGIGQGGNGNACRAAEYRQFDFWVGNWDVQNPNGTPAGSSVVSSALGGCAVLENYLGDAGRSLSAFDDATGTWSQFYVASGGGILLLRGGFRSDSMILSEQRGPVINDIWAWTKLSENTVKQHERVFFNGVPNGGFIGIYVRRADPAPVTTVPVTTCANAPWRQMDFLLGTWDVYEGQGIGQGAAQGSLTVRTGAGGCLLEETITGHASFEGLAYGSYHPQVQRWFRAYIDTDGRYIRMSGLKTGNRMVLTGNRIGANGALVVVRLSWEPVASDRVSQRWDFSLDGGATFVAEREYTLVRR
jgi:hypothetical protein